MVEIKENLMYLHVPLKYPRNTVAQLYLFFSKIMQQHTVIN
jgi:hypothetical protein